MPPARRLAPAVPVLIWGVVLLALGAGLGAWISLGHANEPFAIDVWWSDVLSPARVEPWLTLSYAMNFLGGGWFGVFAVPLGGALVLVLVRRRWAALCFLLASAFSAACVQGAKHVFGRARPQDIIVTTDFGSFPSGHVANAATIAVILAIIFPRVWVMVVGALWVVLMAVSRTHLSAHWLSDTAGGALIGAGAAFIVAAAFVVPLVRERGPRHAGSGVPS